MNKHILVVMRWLNDKDSVSQEELEKNNNEAYAANTHAAYEVYNAAAAADYDYVSQAVYWLGKYFERTGENSNDYRKELNK